MGIFYSVRKSGESVTHPRVRVPNFRAPHLAKLVRGVLTRFSPPGEDHDLCIHPGDAYFISDGYKHGLTSQLTGAFRGEGRTLDKSVWLNFHEYSEADLRARKMHKSPAICHQVEFQHIITAQSANVENRTRLNFKESTTWFDKLGPLPLPPYEQLWNVSFKQKKLMFGASRSWAGSHFVPICRSWAVQFVLLCIALPTTMHQQSVHLIRLQMCFRTL